MYGGSNHLLVPTAALGRLWAPAADAFAVVRVEQSTSAHINAIYPGELTPHIAPHEHALLTSAGHVGRMFNGMKARVLGPAVMPAPPAPWVRYTLPAIELRRLLTEARAANESFRLTYTTLAGEGDEAWRRSASGRTVSVVEDGHGGRTCATSCDGPLGVLSALAPALPLLGCACAPTELALLPPPGWWPTHFFIGQPYPLVEQAGDELVCFGP